MLSSCRAGLTGMPCQHFVGYMISEARPYSRDSCLWRAKAPENEYKGDEAGRTGRIRNEPDRALLEGGSVRRPCPQRHGLVASTPDGAKQVGDQDGESTVDEEPERDPQRRRVEAQPWPREPQHHQENALQASKLMRCKSKLGRGDVRYREAEQGREQQKGGASLQQAKTLV